MPERSGRARAPDSPVPSEHRGEAYTPNADTRKCRPVRGETMDGESVAV
jgi:hypothetical protein